MFRYLARLGMGIASLVIATSSFGSDAVSKLERARSLVDDYYGDRRPLDEASRLVSQVMADEPRSVEALIQGARITIKGGHIVSDKFRPGTVDLYEELINHALALEPNNAPALSLKAEVYILRRDLPNAYRTIQQGLALDPSNPWLRLNLAEYHRRSRDIPKSIEQYDQVIKRGPSPEDRNQRRAYVAALAGLADAFAVPENARILRDLAQKADLARHPKDAWTLGSFANAFNEVASFDDAITYARKALSVMNYGVGRRTLAIALYGKAAQLDKVGTDSASYAKEASALQVDSNEILEWFRQGDPGIAALVPNVERLLRRTKPGTKLKGSTT